MAKLSPLENDIRRRIAQTGPMTVAQYMALCLTHPEHGYYVTRDPFGRDGDFTTAPEISQMFGELIALWAAAVWRLMGKPAPVHLVELGPGRGTMMADALRALQVTPDFRDAIEVSMIEVSPALERRQRQTLAGAQVPIAWRDSFDDVPDGPVLVLANEFFDALPVHQAVRRNGHWHERTVTVDEAGNFAFSLSGEPLPRFSQVMPAAVQHAPEGTIFEWRTDSFVMALARRLVHAGGAAIAIDYGHARSHGGDTFQAIADQRFASPLAAPGNADLTAHVDFEALGRAAESMGAKAYGPVEQGTLLQRLGIVTRAEALKARATAEHAAEIDIALKRLIGTSATDMGRLFKAMALTAPDLPVPPGFEDDL